MITNLYYALDIAIAVAIPVIAIIGYRKNLFSFAVWKLFWIGCAIGSTWEFALYFNQFSENPVILMLSPFPIHPILHPILHSFWDGGLFIAGYFLVIYFSNSPLFTQFSWKELSIMILWGQLQEFFVELSGTFMEAWTYSDRIGWNPVLFDLGQGQITLMPQVVWFIASIVFYFITIKVKSH